MTTTLDSHRDKAGAAASAAEKARTAVTELVNRLHTNATLTTQQTQALHNAEAEARRLKQSLKAATKEKSRLTAARKKAAARLAGAEAKHKAAETKYDKALLADLLRREKASNRAAAKQPAKPPTTPAAKIPAPEQPDPATVMATRTAARRTRSTT